MSNNPLVTVLCVSYNAELYIENAIKSILEQSYDNLELILADDHSTDRTVEIATKILKRYKNRVANIIVNTKNLGITANCNVGLKNCNGDYICLFAADDLMYPDKIESQVSLMLLNQNAVLSYHGVDIIDSYGKKVSSLENKIQKYHSPSDIIRHAGIPYTGSIMIKRSSIPFHGYDESIPSVSDWIFLIECSISGSIVSLPGIYSAYRQHSAGMSRKTFELIEETISTLDIVKSRYPDYDFEKSIIQGKRRYLLGEVARNTKSGNSVRLRRIITSRIINSDLVIKASAVAGLFLIFIGINNLEVSKFVFNFISRKIKN